MTIEEFGSFLGTKSVGRWTEPIGEQLVERVYSAMKRIGKDTPALQWQVSDPSGYMIMRRIDRETYLRYPRKPIMGSKDDIDIEEPLVDALACLVLSGLEMQRTKPLMHLYYIEIEGYNENLIESYMEAATNETLRHNAFGRGQ